MVTPSVVDLDSARKRLAGLLTFAALIMAFAIANSPFYEIYWFIHHTPVSVQVGDFGIDRPLIAWISKGLMVFFFLLIGLEVKRSGACRSFVRGAKWHSPFATAGDGEPSAPLGHAGHRASVRFLQCQYSADVLFTPLTFGIVLGLFLGKPLGIIGMTWLAVRLQIGRLPEGIVWKHLYGVALLVGIGFTMSLFITSLAFIDTDKLAAARFATIIGSLISAVVGLFVLRHSATEPVTERPKGQRE
jgi:Na+/H+ antiporter NhaA